MARAVDRVIRAISQVITAHRRLVIMHLSARLTEWIIMDPTIAVVELPLPSLALWVATLGMHTAASTLLH